MICILKSYIREQINLAKPPLNLPKIAQNRPDFFGFSDFTTTLFSTHGYVMDH